MAIEVIPVVVGPVVVLSLIGIFRPSRWLAIATGLLWAASSTAVYVSTGEPTVHFMNPLYAYIGASFFRPWALLLADVPYDDSFGRTRIGDWTYLQLLPQPTGTWLLRRKSFWLPLAVFLVSIVVLAVAGLEASVVVIAAVATAIAGLHSAISSRRSGDAILANLLTKLRATKPSGPVQRGRRRGYFRDDL